MIYDPITRQLVTLIAKYKEQDHCFYFGRRVDGLFRFVRARYGEPIPGFSGGFAVGTYRDVDINNLVADEGSKEIHAVYEQLKEVSD